MLLLRSFFNSEQLPEIQKNQSLIVHGSQLINELSQSGKWLATTKILNFIDQYVIHITINVPYIFFINFRSV